MTLEGVLGPNGLLDDAAGMRVEEPGSLCVSSRGNLLFSSGRKICSLPRWGDEPELWGEFDAPVSALCVSQGGLVAIGLEGGRLIVRDHAGKPSEGWAHPSELVSVTDCAFLSEDEIVVVDNAYGAEENVLAVAPWDGVARGKIVAANRRRGARVLASNLHCPMGISLDLTGRPIVAQLERASIVDMPGTVRQSGYPAYLGRIRKTATGYLMACLSRRDPLIEFLKTEKDFVAEMKARIEPRHWISPRQTPEFSHDFPIELGATRLFGEVKPWAPSFSYGLVIETDEHLMPIGSAHSRANGTRHAICDVCLWNGDLIAASRASGEILNLGVGSLVP